MFPKNPHKKSICTPPSDVCSSEGFPCPRVSVPLWRPVMEKPTWFSQMPGEDVPDNQPLPMHGLNMDHLLGNHKYAVKMSFQLPRLGALVHQLQVYTCSFPEPRGPGIVHALALKLGNMARLRL
jgi:hypothetical protein